MQSLIEHQQPKKKSEALMPLVRGEAVCLLVNPVDVQHKKRTPVPRLMIAPMSLFGGDSGELMFALEGRGCEVTPRTLLKWTLLWRMGLTERAAKMLISEIENCYQ